MGVVSDDDRDWRAGAYLNPENWPEAIPECGPAREYGPTPWGPKRHDDPNDVDDYPSHHPDAASCGDTYMGDVCPWCGVPLDMMEDVVLASGESGQFIELSDIAEPEVAYHPTCWTERGATIADMNYRTLDEFAAAGED